MRHIDKKEFPAIILDYKKSQEEMNLPYTYASFRYKRALNDILRTEQKHVCCYCEQIITHFQGHNIGGSHNEHLIPQKGVDGDTSLELEYSNIYACCNYSKGLKPNKQYCGEAKGDIRIREILKEKECSTYFKYNILGEILPVGEFLTYKDFCEHDLVLSKLQRDVLYAIQVLNLNCTYLVEERKKVLSSLIKVINSVPILKLKTKIEEMDGEEKHFRFVDMLLFYMKKKSNI